MLRKITRIFFKTVAVIFITVILLLIGLYFGIQSYSFQTWLGKKASAYLSNELNTTISVNSIELDLFSKAKLKNVFILDEKKDTLLYGNLDVDIKNFDYKNQSLILKKVILQNTTTKLIRYKNNPDFNFQFLVNYFSSDKVTRSTIHKKGWDISFGDIELNNIAFRYRDDNSDTSVSHNINFSNLYLKNTSGTFSNLKLDNEVIEVAIKNLKTIDQSGFELNNLTTQAKVSSEELLLAKLYLKTPKTILKGSIHFNYNEFKDYTEFIDKIKMDINLLEGSRVCFTDVAAFTSELNGLNETVYLSGKVDGFVSDLHLKKFKFKYGNHTKFVGNLSLSGLPIFSTTYLNFDAKEISTSYSDLSNFPNYPFTENKKLQLPNQLKQLGIISYQGKFDGFINDFNTTGTLKTALGKVVANISIKLGKKTDDLQYNGKIKTENFNLGALIGVTNLSKLNLNAEVKGKGITLNAINAIVNGQVLACNYNGYNYKNIKLNGEIKNQLFIGLLVSADPNANFDFNGKINFKNKVPEMDFISSVTNLNLSALNLIPSSKADSGTISTQILINLKGDNLDNLTGQINFDDTKYKTKTKSYKLSTFNLDLNQASDDKKITLNSAYINASAQGKFKLNNLQPAFEEFLFNYYPAFFKKPVSTKKYTDQIAFNLTIKNFKTISELFIPDLMLKAGTVLDGKIDINNNSFQINFLSSQLKYKTFVLNNLAINSHEENNIITAVVSGNSINLTDSLVLQNFNLCLNSNDKNTKYNFEWNNFLKPSNKGEIAGRILFNNSFIYIQHDTISVTVRDSTWHLTTSNPTVIDTSGSIIINTLAFANKNQLINISGAFSKKETESLVINTSNVNLDQFNPILNAFKLELNGILNGKVILHNTQNSFAFTADLNFLKLKINNNLLGQLVLKSDYNSKEKYIFLDGYTSIGILDEFGSQQKNIAFKGYYYLDKKDESIDIDFAATPANLKLLNPYLEGILTIKNALVTGKGKIHGSPDNIKIDGKLKLYKSEIKVDYTNVTYNITGEIEILPDQIRFSELLMSENGLKATPQGTINGNLFHRNFTKMQIDYDVSYKNMLVLNTTQNENKTFYGKVYGTGNVGIYGFLNGLHMQITNTTNKHSRFVLPLDGPAEIDENDFIKFVKKDTLKKEEEKLTGFDLDMTINVTPDALTKIILDAKTGDGLNVQGEGRLALKINTLGKFEMFGDYLITNGDYLFTLENVISKKFEIDPGSVVSWSGDPLGAEINVAASYRQRASVAPLLNDTTARYKGRFPVDCKLIITNKLFSPVINFKIEVPTVDATARARINNVLSDEVELNRQVFSFLLFRSFVTPAIFNANSGGVSAGSAAASTGSEMLSNRVSNFLNSYVGNITGIKDLQVGLNYRSGSQTSNQAVDLALSKQFLNNKVSVDGNFGVNQSQTTSGSSALIGDVNIEYKLSEDGRYRLKGFNRTNNNTQVATSGGQFTQGVGLFYREEFETVNQLFNRYLSKLKKNKNEGIK